MPKNRLLLKAGDIVAAYVSKNTLPVEQVPEFLGAVTNKLMELAGQPLAPVQEPAVPISQSYTNDYIICLEDGNRVTLLKRHLSTNFNMTPEEYILKWGLPDDYPMVTKSYSERRSQIAKDSGLGKNP